jgi:hypothetical protein
MVRLVYCFDVRSSMHNPPERFTFLPVPVLVTGSDVPSNSILGLRNKVILPVKKSFIWLT